MQYCVAGFRVNVKLTTFSLVILKICPWFSRYTSSGMALPVSLSCVNKVAVLCSFQVFIHQLKLERGLLFVESLVIEQAFGAIIVNNRRGKSQDKYQRQHRNHGITYILQVPAQVDGRYKRYGRRKRYADQYWPAAGRLKADPVPCGQAEGYSAVYPVYPGNAHLIMILACS